MKMSWRWNAGAFLLATLPVWSVSPVCSWAGTMPLPSFFSTTPTKRIQPADRVQFSMIEHEMRNLIGRRGEARTPHLFCAVGYVFPDGDALTMVIWKNRDLLYWWRGAGSKESRAESITLRFSPVTDLINNVVEDGAILSGSTTLNRSQVAAIRADCKAHGKHYTIPPFKPPKDETK